MIKRKLTVLKEGPIQEPTGLVSTPRAIEREDSVNSGAFVGRAAVVTLGCAKNQVDSEVMLGGLEGAGFEIVSDLAQAEVIVVNTCGFLESAVTESIDAILDASEYKSKGRLRKLLVAGCMVERYREDIVKSLPEVDGFLAIDDLLKVGDFANGMIEELAAEAGRPYFLYDDTMPRKLSTMKHTAYLKISEGCNRPCTFCVIPRIRGGMRSRSVDSILNELTQLGEQGVREVNLVAQDLTDFGRDLKEKRVNFLHLLEQMNSHLESSHMSSVAPEGLGIEWVRLLYAYPLGIDSDLLRALVDLPRVAKYLDLPLQHSSERVLKAMKRPIGRYSPRSIVDLIKSTTGEELALRTTFIVGFPGETEADIAELEDLVRQGHFASVGVFTYSQEIGTPSAELDGQIPQEEKEIRRARIMTAQAEVLEKRLNSSIGTQARVLLESPHEDTDLLLVGRAEWQAPEVDGVVLVNDSEPEVGELTAGRFYDVEFTEVVGYDLVGRVVSESEREVSELNFAEAAGRNGHPFVGELV